MTEAPSAAALPPAARLWLEEGTAEVVYAPYATTTWRVVRPSGEIVYLKATWDGGYPTLAAERDRNLWLRGRGLPVPQVVDHGNDGRVEWLVTLALAGVDATAARHLADPAGTVVALAEGLRAFHEADPTGCPFDHRLAPAIEHAADRVERGEVDPAGFHEEHRGMAPVDALARLRELAPAEDQDVVVTHGDYCFPNVTLQGGRVVGYLDVGEAGLAERWRDLAIATWSVAWNVGRAFEDRFLDAYGAERDERRRDLHRLLYELEA